MTSINYNEKSRIELISLCKERKIKGYAANLITKEKIIQLLKDFDQMKTPINMGYNNMKYDDLLALCKKRKIRGYARDSSGNNIITKANMIKLLEENNCRNSLFDHLTKHNPNILLKFIGNHDILKAVSPGTNKSYTWKCDTSECSNTFNTIPRNVYINDSPRKYCDICSQHNKFINRKKQF